MEKTKIDIRSFSQEELIDWSRELDLPAFRAKQVYHWIWTKQVHDFQDMLNIDKRTRRLLEETFVFHPIVEDLSQKSIDGTIKTRYSLYDDNMIESVLIPVPDQGRFTVCVSSQVGCSLSCSFCATGMMKRMRNLTAAEIYDQVHLMGLKSEEEYGSRLSNIVFMGMGEPLLNYRNVMESIDLISSADGLGYSAKRITISTAGIAKMIKKLADDNSKVNLALSLHAADDEKRNAIMPINNQNNLEALTEALKYYYNRTKNKLSFEYITFKGFNDSTEDAKSLIRLCKKVPAMVNIIEYNPIPGLSFVKSDDLAINQFAQLLRSEGIMATVRKSRGKDIDAACGQLANK